MTKLRLGIALLLLLAPGVTWAQEMPQNEASETADAVTDSEPNIGEQISVSDVTADDEIQPRLREILKATQWFNDVRVEVRDSVVFLEGTTTVDGKKEWAGELARNTEGVAAVVNRIAVNKTIDISGAFKTVVGSVKKLWEDFLARSPLLVAGFLALIVTGFVSKLAAAILPSIIRRSGLRSSLQDLIMQLVTIAVWLIGLLTAAVIVFPGMTPSKVLTVLGLGSVAIGFAFKDIFENFFAGILILWKYPFDRGDYIECGDIQGRIEDITIRMTMIRQVDGQLVVVPNAMLFKNSVDVLTNQPMRRTTIMCGVAYGTDLDQATKVISKAVNSCSTVHFDKPVEIFAREFADSSINFEVTWWTGSTPLDVRESRDEVIKSVKHNLDEAEIEIPFPQRSLRFPSPIPFAADENATAN